MYGIIKNLLAGADYVMDLSQINVGLSLLIQTGTLVCFLVAFWRWLINPMQKQLVSLIESVDELKDVKVNKADHHSDMSSLANELRGLRVDMQAYHNSQIQLYQSTNNRIDNVVLNSK